MNNKNTYKPPYTVTDETINLISEISELLTRITINNQMDKNLRLRKDNRIRTIHASLAIENNSLSLDQVTAIVNGKKILGAPNEICEVQNAFEAYEKLLIFDPYDINDLLEAHKILMQDLTIESGMFRSGGVGIFAGGKLVHAAPSEKVVPQLIADLFNWLKTTDTHPLIKSCVFHYEFEFIHPFSDGNGRMGRMWQTLLLYQWKEVFGWLPIETLVRERQQEYYEVLRKCDLKADSGMLIEFILKTIYDTLIEIAKSEQVYVQVTEQVEKLLRVMNNEPLSTKELMELVGLKHRPTFSRNYLAPTLELGYIEMIYPDKPNSSKQKYMKVK